MTTEGPINPQVRTTPAEPSEPKCIRLVHDMAVTSQCDLPASAPVHLLADDAGGHPFETYTTAESPVDRSAMELLALFDGVPIRFGMRAQGHVPTVERMLAEGATWDEIGAAIGWQGKAAKDWYERFEVDRSGEQSARERAYRLVDEMFDASVWMDLPRSAWMTFESQIRSLIEVAKEETQ